MKTTFYKIGITLIISFISMLLICGIYVAVNNSYNFEYIEITPIENYETVKDDSLDLNTNYIKNTPNKYLVQLSIVCANFPELKNELIEFEYDDIATTMQAKPQLDSFFRKRKYLIIMNNNDSFEGIKFDDIPFNAQIGLLAHEFCHLMDYKQKSFCELVGLGVSYNSNYEKVEYEREIDFLTIKKGFGYQLRDWAQYAMYDSYATCEYKIFKKEFYLNPKEIDSIINSYKNYARQNTVYKKTIR